MQRKVLRTPFHYHKQAEGWRITSDDGTIVAVAVSRSCAAAICKALNLHGVLMQIFHLARGELEGQTQPYRYPSQQALAALFDKVLRTGTTHR